MYPSGIVYQSNRSGSSGEKSLHPGLITRLFYHLVRGFGAGLVAFAIAGLIFSFWPVIQGELNFDLFSHKTPVDKFGDIILKVRAELATQVAAETANLGIDPNFSIYIPKIDAKANVIPNVDAGNPDAYLAALSEGVAHAKGTNFPGQGKTIYLFSHSTDSPLNFARYNAVFYLLRKLTPGDRITIYFLDKKYVYQVTDKFVTTPTDTSWLADDGSGERLILQTCDPPGTSWNRLLVIAKPI